MSVTAARDFMDAIAQDPSMHRELDDVLAGGSDPVGAVSAFALERGFDVQPEDLSCEATPDDDELSDDDLDSVSGGAFRSSYSSRGIIIINGHTASSKGIIIING